MMKNLNYVYLLAFALILQSCWDNQRAKNYNDKTLVDQYGLQFILTANDAGLTEIKASTVAETVSQNPRVVAFAKMMVTDHSQAGKELSDLAKSKYVDKPDTINTAHQNTIDSIAKLTGADFDKAYMKMMVKDHVQAVMLFDEATKNKNSAVEKFAKKTLPTLKMHSDSANAIYSSLK